jgi:hypothetical protein
MIGDKQEHFQGKGTDLAALGSHIEEYLKNDGFKVQTSAPSAQGAVIQAKKGGFLAGVIDADRALTITIDGSSTSQWLRSRPCLFRTCSSLWTSPSRRGTSRSRRSSSRTSSPSSAEMCPGDWPSPTRESPRGFERVATLGHASSSHRGTTCPQRAETAPLPKSRRAAGVTLLSTSDASAAARRTAATLGIAST